MKLGIYDIQDDCWLGVNDKGTGPKTFDDPELAEVAREVACKQLGWPYSRLVIQPFVEAVLVEKDEVPTKMTTAKALRKLEEGL